MTRSSTVKTGDAGEYAVAAELARRGWTVDLPRRNQRGIDLYAYLDERDLTVGVQVKTRLPRSKGFRFDDSLLDQKPEANVWLVLVSLANPGARSSFDVVPRQHVSAILLTFAGIMQERGRRWTARYLGAQEFTGYSEKWDLMLESTSSAPWLMPPWVKKPH